MTDKLYIMGMEDAFDIIRLHGMEEFLERLEKLTVSPFYANAIHNYRED